MPPSALSPAGSSGLSPAAIASGSPGLILITSVPGSRLAISRYSALAGSTTSHGMPRAVAASSRHRTVCDLPAPVAPQTNTCRLSESAATANGPAGIRFRSSTSPSLMPPAGVSGVTSNSGRKREANPGYFRLRRPDQRGEQLGGPVEGARPSPRTGVAAGPARSGADRGRAQRVRQPAEVGRRAEQPGDPSGAGLIGPARH